MIIQQQYAGTALITGASSGIGAAFARQLASQGMNLMLVARRRQRLEQLAEDLTTRHAVKVDVLVADLAQEQDLLRVENGLSKTEDLAILINNAGFGTAGVFTEIALEKTLNMIAVHVTASTRLSWTALQSMLNRKHGAIINVSSMAAFLPFPTSVNYCATKIYLNMFSEALQNELRATNIIVQALCPGFTYSEFHDTDELKDTFDRSQFPKWMWMHADEVVAYSLAALSKKQVIVVPGRINRLLVWLMTNWMTSRILRKIMEKLHSVK